MINIDVSRDEAVVELTQELVRIPSENPTRDEIELGKYIAELLKAHDIETEVQPVQGERANVIGRLRGAGGPPLVLIAHLDTVPIGDKSKWTHNPFGGEIVDGKLYGRGSCDMKSGTAAAIITLLRLKQENVKLSGDLILACTIDEETATMHGSHALGTDKAYDNAYLLTMEPTECKLNVAHKGAFWYEASFTGKAAHAANPQIGADANRAMAEAILGWYEGSEKWSSQYQHPLLGSPTLIVSVINGGFKTNVVSEFCRAEIDCRVPPPVNGEIVQKMLEEVAAPIAKKYGVEFNVKPMSEPRPPVECNENSPLVKAFDVAYQQVTGHPAEHLGFLAYTDAAMMAVMSGNQNAVVFGPGSLTNAHTVNEFVEVNQIYTALRVLEGTARELLVQK